MVSPARNRTPLFAALALLGAPALAWLVCLLDRGREPRGGAAPGAAGVSHARLWFKHGLLDEVAAGRLTLLGAAGRLAAYHAAEPAVEGARSGSELVGPFPGRTEQERCARNLAAWARGHAAGRPSEATERLALRLERELALAYGEPAATPQLAEQGPKALPLSGFSGGRR
jgi:hypothetical protein